jgi:hypothetical protein
MPAQTVIKLRRGTASQWTTANPTLAAGEIGLETDTLRTKYGNGSSTWTALSYSVADASGTSSVDWTSVLNKPATFTPSAHTHTASNITDIQTYVDGRIDLVIAGAPAALNTLDELAAALGDDANFAGTVTTALNARATKDSPTFTGTVVLPSTTSIGNVSATEIAFVDGVTSSIQTQINGKANTSHTHSMQQVNDMPHPFLLMGA